MSNIEISLVHRKTPDSAGGVGVLHKIYNASDKTIKYLTFTYIPYNSVGDIVKCTIKKITEARAKLTGPIEPNKELWVEWDVLWYNPTVSKVELKEITVEYMDGSEEIILGTEIKNMDDEDSVYYERIGKAEKAKEEAREKEKLKNTMKCSYIPFLVLSNIESAKTNEDMRFHTNQGLILFALEVLGFILGLILGNIPFVGAFIMLALWIVAAVFSVKGIIDIKRGVKNELPLIGKIKLLK